MRTTDDILAHYGVRGMKWGVRRPIGPNGRVMSDDAKKAADITSKKRSTGVKSLSNDELKTLNERLRLEQELSRLTTNDSTYKQGMAFTRDVLGTAKTASEIYNLVNSPMGKSIRDLLDDK